MFFCLGEAVIAAGIFVKRVFLWIATLDILIDDFSVLLQSKLLVVVNERN